MLWTTQQQFLDWPLDKEVVLKGAIAEIETTLFGNGSVYFGWDQLNRLSTL